MPKPSDTNLQSLDRQAMAKAYSAWAPVYDTFYDKLLRTGRQAAVAAAQRAGPDLLEVGVGTGLSLGSYPHHARVIGVDLSEAMLARARARAQTLPQVAGLACMDAGQLGFADARFDAVVAQYVIALVPDAEAALDEFARVLKPGGEIVIVNHLGAEGGVIAAWERAVAPLVKRIGLSSHFRLKRIQDWATPRGFVVQEARRIGFAGFSTLVRLRRP